MSSLENLTPMSKRQMFHRVESEAMNYINNHRKYLEYLFSHMVDGEHDVYFWDTIEGIVVHGYFLLADTGEESDFIFNVGSYETYDSYVRTYGSINTPLSLEDVVQVGIEPFHPDKHLHLVTSSIGEPDIGSMSKEEAIKFIEKGTGLYLITGNSIVYHDAKEVTVYDLNKADGVCRENPKVAHYKQRLQHMAYHLDSGCVWLSDEVPCEFGTNIRNIGKFLSLDSDLNINYIPSDSVKINLSTEQLFADLSLFKNFYPDRVSIKHFADKLVPVSPIQPDRRTIL